MATLSTTIPRRIFVVDDHPIVREGIAQLLAGQPDLFLCGDAPSAALALEAVRAQRPDVVLVDISLGRESGLDLVRALALEEPAPTVLVLSMHDETVYARRVLRLGARGYIMKHEGAHLLLEAIRTVLRGDIYVSSSVNASLLRTMSAAAGPRTAVDGGTMATLTDRELQVYRLVGDGLGTREIALALHLSAKTVESHRLRIKQKLGIATATGLVAHAAQWLRDSAGG